MGMAHGEHTMHYDEVGALHNRDEKTSPFTQINTIISGNTVPMPSASLGGKNQIPRPHLVIRHVDTRLSETARNFLISLMMIYEFCDDNFDPTM